MHPNNPTPAGAADAASMSFRRSVAIAITGKNNSGKTHLAWAIAAFLKERGLEVTFLDESLRNRAGAAPIEYLAGRTSVALKVANKPRPSRGARRAQAALPVLVDALEYALPYLRACVPSPRDGINANGSTDTNCVARAVAALALAKGEARLPTEGGEA